MTKGPQPSRGMQPPTDRFGATESGYPSSLALLWGGIGLGGIALMVFMDVLMARAL
jgi:hypothetical protein